MFKCLYFLITYFIIIKPIYKKKQIFSIPQKMLTGCVEFISKLSTIMIFTYLIYRYTNEVLN